MVKVKLNVPPPEIIPESKEVGPLVEVAVCDAPSLLVQVTVSPECTVKFDGGLKAKPCILTDGVWRVSLASVICAKPHRLERQNNNAIHNTHT